MTHSSMWEILKVHAGEDNGLEAVAHVLRCGFDAPRVRFASTIGGGTLRGLLAARRTLGRRGGGGGGALSGFRAMGGRGRR